MITNEVLRRILGPIKRRIALLIGRMVLTNVESNTGHAQKLNMVGLADETVSRAEQFQPYGVEAYPVAANWSAPPAVGGVSPQITNGAEAICLFFSGARDRPAVIVVHDRRYRPTDLKEGEVVIYTKWNQESYGHEIRLEENGKIVFNCKEAEFNVVSQFTVNCPSVDFNS